MLLEEFLKPMEISQNALARAIGVSPRRINEIVLEMRSVSADMALRLARAFGTSEQFWMGLQADYDLEEAGGKLRKVQSLAARDKEPVRQQKRGMALTSAERIPKYFRQSQRFGGELSDLCAENGA